MNMKNINKILLISVGLFVLLFTSCEEELPEREPSPETLPGCAKVYFPNTNETSLELDDDVTSIPITVMRGNTSGAITVPLTVLKNDSNLFVIPETVNFGDGEAEVTFNVSFPGAIAATDYTFDIIVEGDQFIDAYTIVEGEPSLAVTITLIKWVKFATGEYYGAYTDNTWTQDLYRADGTNKYRFYDLWNAGYNWDFTWDGGEAIIPGGALQANGYYYSETGYIDADGMIGVFIDASTDWTYYDALADEFWFDGYWTSPGAWLDDIYTITERF